MNYYEGMYILDATLSDDKIKELADSITGELAEKGEVLAVEKLGKKALTYPIKKMTEGFYMVVYFSSESEEIARLHGKYGLNTSIIRVMILRRKEEEIRKIKEKIGSKAEPKEEDVSSHTKGEYDWNAPEKNWKKTEDFPQMTEEDTEDNLGETEENSEEIE